MKFNKVIILRNNFWKKKMNKSSWIWYRTADTEGIEKALTEHVKLEATEKIAMPKRKI